MINEQDLPTLIKLQELLNERDDSTPVTFIDFLTIEGSLMSEGEKGNLKNSDKDFEVLSEVLIEHGIAELFVSGGITDQLLKTNKTHKIKIEDIFKQQQEDKQRKDVELKAMTTDIKSKSFFSAPNLANYIAAGCAVLTLIYALYTDSKLKSCEKEKVLLEQEATSLQKANAQYVKDSLFPTKNDSITE